MSPKQSAPRWVVKPDLLLKPGLLASEALHQMAQLGVRCAPVINGSEKLLGIFCRDDSRSWSPDQLALVADVMKREVFALSPTSTLERIQAIFQEIPDSLIPMVDDDNRLVGVVYRMALNHSGAVAVTHLKTPS
jgi:CBS domain-containing protein